MKSYDVLDPLSPLYGNIFIEASAGTGKTFAIEHMVLRLILGGMSITEILVVTFTKAGALDLKRRIHSSLLEITEMLSTGNLIFPYLTSIGNKEEALFLIKNACALSSEMPVCTIHSFAFQMLSSFAFEAGVDFDLLDFEDDRQKDLTLIAILDTLRAENSEHTISASQCTKMMDESSRVISAFAKKVTSIMVNTKNLVAPPPFSKLQLEFLEELNGKDLVGLEADFLAIASHFKGCANLQKQIHPTLFDQIQLLKDGDLDGLIASCPSLIELLQEENLKKSAPAPKNNLLFSLCKNILPIIKIAKDPNFPITHIAIKAKRRLDQMAVKSPDAILYSMLDALKKGAFESKVRALFNATIIDEFQDTDPVQWKILSTLFFNHARTFCTVGDPKQSIYAFRGADLPTYLLAKKSFSNHFSLDTNFRSQKTLIDALNRFFSEETSPGFLSFEEHSEDLKYQQIRAGKTEDAFSVITLCLCPPLKRSSVRTSLSELEQLYFFPHIANTITSLDLPLDQIAILVKDRYQGLAVSLYLQKMNIPAKANISASLIDSSPFSLFENLLFLTYNPRSESLLKKLLSHSLIDAPLDLLKDDLKNPVLQQLSIDFSLLKNILEEDGLFAYLSNLMDKKIFEGRSLGELLTQVESNYLTMMQIFSLFLRNFDKDPVQFITEIQKLDPDTFSYLKKDNGTDKKSVTIMTSHLSKGLEFEAVFALSLYNRMKLSLASEQEAILVDKEKMRLLYVTLTRAKSHLYIYGTLFGNLFPLVKGCGSPLELFLSRVNSPFLDYDALYKRASTLTASEVIDSCPIPTGMLFQERATKWETGETSQVLYPPTKPFTYEKMAQSLSFSSLPFKEKEHVPVLAPAEFPTGSKVGNQIHLILEKIIEEGLYVSFSKDLILPVIQKSFFQTSLAGFEELVYTKLEGVFSACLESNYSRFRLKDIPPEHMWQEVLFHYTLEGSCCQMKGFADLIFFHEGRFYILDWKCNHLEGYSQNQIKEALVHHNYTKQASIYTRALQSFIAGRNLPFEEYAGGAFYIFIRGGKDGAHYFTPQAMIDREVLCLK